MKITWIGHATCQIEIGPFTLLTDPNFSDRILGIRRCQKLTLSPERLLGPTAVLLSHAHYDHFDISSFKFMPCGAPVVLPRGLGRLAGSFLPNPMIELEQWSAHTFRADGAALTVTRVPARHRGGRVFHLMHTQSAGYVIQSGSEAVYFAGDTGMMPHFGEIASLATIDLALLPLGPLEPHWFMRPRHLDSHDLLRAATILKAHHCIPIHWGSFKLGLEPADQAAQKLEALAAQAGMDTIHLLKPGQSFTL